jgi:hypothetical protein
MKLTKEDLNALNGILKVCSLGNIQSIIIDDGAVYGVNDARNFAIVSTGPVPKLEQKMGLSRLSNLRQRLDIFGLDATLSTTESGRGETSTIEFSAGRSKSSFRCSSTMLIRAPREINDPPTYSITIMPGELKTLMSAARMKDSARIGIIVKKSLEVSLTVIDSVNDTFDMVLEQPAELVAEEAESVCHYVKPDLFTSTLSAAANKDEPVSFVLGERGSVSAIVYDHTVTLLPIAVDDGDDDE